MGFLLLDNLSGQDFYGMLAKRQLRTARIVLGILLAILLGYLIFGEKPWDTKFVQGIDKVMSSTPEGAKPKLKLEHYVVPWCYGAAAFNAFLCTILLATAGTWAKPAPDTSMEGDNGLIVDAHAWWDSAWWFWGLLLLVLMVALGVRMPGVGKSVWWDEAWTVKRVIVGYQEPVQESPQELRFRSASWQKTFFQYDKPTNHVGYSVMARFCVDTWRNLTGAEPWEFSETALRMPALLAGLLSVALAGMIMKDWGHPWLGLITAALLAIHAWHIRYSVDARAFTVCAAFSLLAVWALGNALKHGSWRYWILYALSKFMLLWSFPYTIFYVVLLSVAAVLGIFIAYGNMNCGRYLQRFLVCSTVAGMLFLQLTLPWWPQTKHWGGTMDGGNVEPVNAELVTEFWVQTATGTPWKLPGVTEEDKLPNQHNVIGSLPLPLRLAGYALVFGALPFLLLVGVGRLLLSRSPSALVTLVPLLGLVVTMVVAAVRDDWFYERYLFFGMPFIIIVMVLGAFHLLAGTEGSNRLAGFISVGVLCAIFIMLSAAQLGTVITRPTEPLRDVANFFKERRGADPTLPIRVGYQHGGVMPALYDPWIRTAHTAEDLREFAAEAIAKKSSMYVFYGHENFNRGMFPDGFLYMDNPLLFAEREYRPGLEPDYGYRILEYRGVPWPEAQMSESDPEGKPTLTPQTRLGEVNLRDVGIPVTSGAEAPQMAAPAMPPTLQPAPLLPAIPVEAPPASLELLPPPEPPEVDLSGSDAEASTSAASAPAPVGSTATTPPVQVGPPAAAGSAPAAATSQQKQSPTAGRPR